MFRQEIELTRDFERYLDLAGFGKSRLYIPAKRGGWAVNLSERRMKQMRDRPNFNGDAVQIFPLDSRDIRH
jgi:hypothetical protein